MVTSPESDRELIKRMIRGDESAFDSFIDDYYPRLYRFAYRRMRSDREATQDIVQNTFAKLIPKLGAYRGEAALFSWICAFCRYEIAAYWRDLGRRPPEVELAEDAPAVRSALESLASYEDGVEAEIERRQLGRLVRAVLDVLPIRYGNALEWKYLHDLSVKEVAARLQTTPKAAESVLARARRAFRDGFVAVIGE